MAQSLSGALSLDARDPVVLLLLSLAVVAPYELIVYALTKTSPLQEQSASVETTIILLLVAFALVGPLVSALYVNALVAIGEQQRPSITTVVRQGLRALPVVAAAQIIAGIGIGIGFVLFIVPGVFLALRFAVVAQVAAIERTDWPGALRRSGALTRGSYLRIFGLLLCVYGVTVLITSGGSAVVGKHGASALDVAVGIVAATLTQSFQALVSALLYFDLRVRQSTRT